MSRARNIKPGFFKNEDLAECTLAARLCFAGLWTLADREGRLEDRPKRMKGELFPFDNFDVEPLLCELERFGFIHRYEVDGLRLVQVVEFKKHQTPHYSEKASVLKPYPFLESVVDDAGVTPGGLPEDSKKEGVIKRGSQLSDSLIPDSLIPENSKPPNPQGGKPGEAPSVGLLGSQPAAARKPRPKSEAETLETFIARCDGAGDAYVAEDDTIFDYAESIRLPIDFVELAWFEFRRTYAMKRTLQKDWRAHFRNAVRRNWFKLWWVDGDGFSLTTAGKQAKLAAGPAPKAVANG